MGSRIPTVRLVDNLGLDPATYRILVAGQPVAVGQVRPDSLLAMDPPEVRQEIAGDKIREPVFGMPARWIKPELRDRALLAGYTVVDATSAIVTHLGEMLCRHAAELLSREDLRRLLDELKETHPTIVEEVKLDPQRLGKLHGVLKLLLEERVPLTDFSQIVESFLQHTAQFPDLDALADQLRHDIGRNVCDRYRDRDGLLQLILVDPALEMDLRQLIHEKNVALNASQLTRLIAKLEQLQQRAEAQGQRCAIACHRQLRRPLRRAIRRSLPNLHTIALTEIPSDLLTGHVGVLGRYDLMATTETNAEQTEETPWTELVAA